MGSMRMRACMWTERLQFIRLDIIVPCIIVLDVIGLNIIGLNIIGLNIIAATFIDDVTRTFYGRYATHEGFYGFLPASRTCVKVLYNTRTAWYVICIGAKTG